ncbi:MAG: cytidine deaminase [Anaerolineales bacterium]|nr:cytidine deaminase [Anaerolineales bacterium]
MLTDEMREKLIQEARQARSRAYAPYSNYTVGAALLTASGQIYTGANIENAAYPDTICAERVAVFKAVFEGEKEFIAIAVVSSNGGFPCGSCRQVLAEFGLQTRVLVAKEDGALLFEATLGDLLPGAFLPEHLNERDSRRGG